jgi:hypothetical protein
MLYLKSVLIGIGGAIAAAFLWIVVSFWLPLFAPTLVSPLFNRGGSGVSGAVITSESILLAALFGFIAAAGWALRRFRVAP